MTKNLKKALLTVFLVLFSACMCLFAACQPKTENTAVTYTVTVKTNETTPAKGVRVRIGKTGVTFPAKNTDENGKAEFELEPDDYTVSFIASSLPENYSVPEDADLTLTKTKTSCTVMLAENFAYKVSLVNPDGTPYYAEGVTVGICTLQGNCLTPNPLGTNGVARCPGAKGDYHVQILNLPATAAYECDGNGYYTGENFSATKTEMTITIYPVVSVTDLTPMTAEEKAACAQKSLGYTARENAAYHVTVTLAANETAYYVLMPEFDGEFAIYKSDNANYVQNGAQFQKGNNGIGLFNAFPPVKAGEKYYFKATNLNSSQISAEFIVEAPAATSTEIIGVGTVEASIFREGANAVIALQAKIGATFQFSAEGSLKAAMASSERSTFANDFAPADGDYRENAKCNVKFTPDLIGRSLYIAVAVKDAPSYPVKVTIKVEKIATLQNNVIRPQVEEELTKFADQTDSNKELTYVPVNGSANLYYDQANGYYRLGGATGEIVVVRLTTNINDENRLGVSGALANLDYATQGQFNPYVIDTTSVEDAANLNKGKTLTDFREMLRGFGAYEYEMGDGRDPVITQPDFTAETYYTKFVNADGVYPLTKELETFLKLFAANNPNVVPKGTDAWLFACYYYGDKEAPADAIVGSYELSSYTFSDTAYALGDKVPTTGDATVELAKDSITLTVRNSGFSIVSTVFTDANVNGAWTKTSGYSFSYQRGEDTVALAVAFNSATGTLTLTDSGADAESSADDVVYVFKKA